MYKQVLGRRENGQKSIIPGRGNIMRGPRERKGTRACQ